MKKILIVVSAMLLALGMLGVAGASTITASPLNSTVTVGDSFTVAIVGSGFTDGAGGTTGGGLTITWDPDILTLDDTLISPNPTGNPSLFASVDYTFPGDMSFGVFNEDPVGTFNNPAVLDTAGGSFSFSVTSLNGTSSNSFSIADLTFLASGLGLSNLDITVSTVDVWSDQGFGTIPTPVDADGSVQVNAVPIPGSILLLGSGLVGLIGIARRKMS